MKNKLLALILVISILLLVSVATPPKQAMKAPFHMKAMKAMPKSKRCCS